MMLNEYNWTEISLDNLSANESAEQKDEHPENTQILPSCNGHPFVSVKHEIYTKIDLDEGVFESHDNSRTQSPQKKEDSMLDETLNSDLDLTPGEMGQQKQEPSSETSIVTSIASTVVEVFSFKVGKINRTLSLCQKNFFAFKTPKS